MAFLAAIDRSRLVTDLLAGSGQRADTPIPPSSWAFDPKATPAVAYDRTAAVAGLRAAGWTKSGTGWLPPKAKRPVTIELLAADASVNPVTARARCPCRRGLDLARDPHHGHVAGRPAPSSSDCGAAPSWPRSPTSTSGWTQIHTRCWRAPRSRPAARTSRASRIRRSTRRSPRPARRGPLPPAVPPTLACETLLGKLEPILPLFFRDSVFVVSDRLAGPTAVPVADPSGRFWDVIAWSSFGR